MKQCGANDALNMASQTAAMHVNTASVDAVPAFDAIEKMEPERFYHKSITMAKKRGLRIPQPLDFIGVPMGI